MKYHQNHSTETPNICPVECPIHFFVVGGLESQEIVGLLAFANTNLDVEETAGLLKTHNGYVVTHTVACDDCPEPHDEVHFGVTMKDALDSFYSGAIVPTELEYAMRRAISAAGLD